MKSSELRIGNWVLDAVDFKECVITLDDFACMGNFERTNHPIPYMGIPITPEWLEQLGLSPFLGRENVAWYDLANGWLRPRVDGFWAYEVGDNCEVWIEIKYIHQLQNLYFVFTGQELTIKP